jgi:hypothetical protein
MRRDSPDPHVSLELAQFVCRPTKRSRRPGQHWHPRLPAPAARLSITLEGGAMPKYGGRRYGYGRPGRRVRGYYRARSRQPGPIPGCLLPLVLAAAIAVHIIRENGHRGPD